MLCKYCGGRTIIKDGVDNKKYDETYKLRVCMKCGKTFYTVEFPIEINEKLCEEWITNHKNHRPLMPNSFYTKEGRKNLLSKNKKGSGK